jgi:Carbon starvation protein CstA
MNNRAFSWLAWAIVVILGTISFAVIALNRGETINAAWLVIAAVCTYLIAYRLYGLFITNKVLGIDATRPTPAHRRNDGLDYVPTNKYVLFGHHFAAISGAGPLVGPVLAAQMGYLPGTLWILAGVVFAGAVQDMTVLFCRSDATAAPWATSSAQKWAPSPGASRSSACCSS